MIGPNDRGTTTAVDEAVESYEEARGRDGRADLEAFLLAPDHPSYLAVLCELVRVELEYSFERAEPNRLENYERRFPELFREAGMVREIAFEEYRLRLQAGEAPSATEYRERYGVDDLDWPANDPDPGDEEDRHEDRTPTADEMSRAATVYRSYRRDGGTDLAARFASSEVSREQADVFEAIDRDDPTAADRLARGLVALPEAGGRFLGFRLRSELGRGAFGRVFLAEQEEMAGRPVALKITPDAGAEVNALAQLQHTNVVPIYSVHRQGALQALCMPYFGPTTLADVIAGLDEGRTLPDSGRGLLSTLNERKSRLPGGSSRHGDLPPTETSPPMSGRDEALPPAVVRPTAQIERIGRSNYVDAILWIGAALADGLAHSHERGILHRDLKPANVLFADDGEPMLLDFNLAADSKLRGRASSALVGGTLPYMPLEQLEAFQGKPRWIDARSDLFSLGVILFQLLSGRHPFEVHRGPVDGVIGRMIEDRRRPAPSLWTPSKPGSPAVDAIIRRLLDPDPDRRYRSARDLQEDLRRQLDHRPLRHTPEPSRRERLTKWARRHPRLTSTASLVAVSLAMIASLATALVVRHARVERLEAHDSLARLMVQVRDAESLLYLPDAPLRKIDEGMSLCQRAVDAYGARSDPHWQARPSVAALSEEERVMVRHGVGELLALWARGLAWKAEAETATDRRAGSIEEAGRLIASAEAAYGSADTPRVLKLQSAELARLAGRAAEAERLRAEAESIPLRTARERLTLASTYLDTGMDREAFALAEEASRFDPLDFSVWFLRGRCLARLAQHERADQSFRMGLDLKPDHDLAYFHRGRVALERRDYDGAVSDFDRVLRGGLYQSEALLNRALANLGRGNAAGSIADLDRLLKRGDAPTRALFIRAHAREALGDKAAAEADRREGLARLPADELSWVTRGLNRLPADPAGAIADFHAALKLNPRSLDALQNEASVLSESLGRAADAVEVLDRAIAANPQSVAALAGRSVVLARLGRRDAALKDAALALALDDSADTLYRAACTFALTSKGEPGDAAEALRLLALAVRKDVVWLGQMDGDPDLAPLRDRPDYRRLREALGVVSSPTAAPK